MFLLTYATLGDVDRSFDCQSYYSLLISIRMHIMQVDGLLLTSHFQRCKGRLCKILYRSAFFTIR